MDISEFRSHAMTGAEAYYRFLDENGRGRVTVRVQRIEPKSKGFVCNSAIL